MNDPSTSRTNRLKFTQELSYFTGEVLILPSVLQPTKFPKDHRKQGQIKGTYHFPDEGLEGRPMAMWRPDSFAPITMVRYEQSGRQSVRTPLPGQLQIWLTDQCERDWQQFLRSNSLGPNASVAAQFMRRGIDCEVVPASGDLAPYTRIRSWKFWGIWALYPYDPRREHELAAHMADRWRESTEITSDVAPAATELPPPIAVNEG